MNPPPPPPPPPAESATVEGAPRHAWGMKEAIERPGHLPLIDAAGEFFGFVVQGLRGMRSVSEFSAEVLRQVGLLVAGSVLVIVFISFIAGASCGIAAEAIGQAIGASIAGPLFSSFCTAREVVPFVFGFIVAAKVGGGIVAQLGAMRVNEEVDALEVMGIPSITYLVSTRMAAAAIVMPIAYLLALGAGMGASWITSFVRAGSVSQGTWEEIFYSVTTISDLIYTMIKGIVLSGAVILTALYFGYRVRGGPVEVGTATAQSMAVNLILCTVLNMVLTFLFWGFDPGLADRMSPAAGEGSGGPEAVPAKRSPMRIGPYATRVVAISVLAIILVVVLLLIAASKNTYEVRAVFDDVRGLIPGGDVTAGSIVVGKVTDVHLNDNRDPEVVMQVDDDFRLHKGAFANIKLASNVGAVNRVVDLSQGDLSQPELKDGATLMGKQTDNPVDFDLAVSTLTPKVRGDIKKILINLDASIKHRGADFDRTLHNSSVTLNETANLLGEVNADGAALKTLVAQGQRVVTALAADPQDLGAATDRLAGLLQATASRQTELAQTTRQLGPALASGRQLLERTSAAVPHLQTLVDRSGPLVDALGPFADEVTPATRAAAPFLAETKKLVRNTPGQLREQAKFVNLARPVAGKLAPLLDRLNPIADQLRVYTPETVGFFQNVADAASNYDRNGHLIRVRTLAANSEPMSTGSRTLGPSDCGPGLLQAPYNRTPGVNECQPWTDWQSSLGEGGSADASSGGGG